MKRFTATYMIDGHDSSHMIDAVAPTADAAERAVRDYYENEWHLPLAELTVELSKEKVGGLPEGVVR